MELNRFAEFSAHFSLWTLVGLGRLAKGTSVLEPSLVSWVDEEGTFGTTISPNRSRSFLLEHRFGKLALSTNFDRFSGGTSRLPFCW